MELCFHLSQCLFVVAILFFEFGPVLLFQLAIDSVSARNLFGQLLLLLLKFEELLVLTPNTDGTALEL